MRTFSARLNSRGSALILVFWCVLLLTIAVFAVVELTQLSVDHSAHEEETVQARTLALSGVAIAQAPQLLKNDPLLAPKTAAGEGSYRVVIGGEAARLNLNFLLQYDHRDVLISLFSRWGMSLERAGHVADCLYDWVTPGDLPSLHGAKDSAYAEAGLSQRPTHQPFTSWQQVGLVLGVDELTAAKPDWQDSFTLWSQGPLNVNEAPAELIAAVFGLPVDRLVSFVEARNGPDGVPGTADDTPIKDSATLQEELGLSDTQMKPLAGLVTFGDTIRRIESVGQAGQSRVMISVVARLNLSPPQYLLWSEH